METIQVLDVQPKDNGWYEVSLEDGRVASTKNRKIADAAFASRGGVVDALISEKKSGNFTNIYLNAVGDVSDDKTNGTGAKKDSRPAARTGGGGKSPEEQKKIIREWAMGRATELLRDSGEDYKLPPDAKLMGVLATTADLLLAYVESK